MMNVFRVCLVSAGEERSAVAVELLPAQLPAEFVIAAAGGGGEAKHESSYTLHVLQPAAPLAAAAATLFCRCLKQTEDRWWVQAADWHWPALNMGEHSLMLVHITCIALHYPPPLHCTPLISNLAFNKSYFCCAVQQDISEELFMQAVDFMAALYCLLQQKHTWAKQVTFQATERPHTSAGNHTVWSERHSNQTFRGDHK